MNYFPFYSRLPLSWRSAPNKNQGQSVSLFPGIVCTQGSLNLWTLVVSDVFHERAVYRGRVVWQRPCSSGIRQALIKS
jgi:hypothetical protein